ncbi:envelope integrity protein Cei [Nocardia stercoris]|uniref:LytR family transcriptional regulator n=1 Tax=Nocardia stercoris TaxID=2483361 RepID=A0A3M2KY78_9NOCA|nr:envelope integrity protein Cei [Nocardia stercoris]RMI30211.1 LytR family transcriptional regulator [Nocardia stercoris]
MVSLITEGSASDAQGRPFPRRRHQPWVAVVAVLFLICAVVWIKAFTTTERSHAAPSCAAPTAPANPTAAPPAPLGQRVSNSRLHDVEPAALSQSKVRVFNASGKSGLAEQIATRLRDYGFASPPPPMFANDPVYVNNDLECVGQIRYGVDGRPAAAAAQLIAPCAELIEDGRTDDTVDLALGSLFGNDLRPGNDAEEVLKALKNAPPNGASIDSTLLAAARNGNC